MMIANLILDLSIIACAVIWGCAALIFILWLGYRVIMHLATRHLEKAPVPYWPADGTIEALIPIVMCPLCRPDPRPGACTCGRACGDRACVFAHVELTGLNAADERFMSGKGEMP